MKSDFWHVGLWHVDINEVVHQVSRNKAFCTEDASSFTPRSPLLCLGLQLLSLCSHPS